MNGLQVVQTKQSWGIYGPKIGDPTLFNTPEEALAELVLHPTAWPEDVDFWLHLTKGRGEYWDAVAYQRAELKRPTWINAALLRLLPETEVCAVNFWFFGRFVEALLRSNYRYLVIQPDGTTEDGSILSGYGLSRHPLLNNQILLPFVTFPRSLSKDFLIIDDWRVLQFIGLAPINTPAAHKGFVYRKSHRWLP